MLKYYLFAGAAVLLLAQPAAAQSAAGQPLGTQNRPSADQIINALKPTGAIQAGTRGIRPLAPGPLAPGAAAPATEASSTAGPARSAATTTYVKPPSLDLTVQFEFGSAELTTDAARTLDELGRALTSATLAVYRFRIEGHTDTVGTPDFNKNLSDQRAAVVARYLEGKFGVSSGRLDTVGLGDTALLVATPPQTPELRNRRVHVVNLGA